MSRLDDAFGGRSDPQGFVRVGAGIGLLFAGVVVLAAGVLGVVVDVAVGLGVDRVLATRLAVLLAGALTIAVPVGEWTRTSSTTGRRVVAGGLALASLSVLLASLTLSTSGSGTLPAVPGVLWAAYGAGLALAFAGVLTGRLAPTLTPTTPSTHSTVGYTRDTNQVTPADGGEDRDDLTFPLDEDE